MLQVGQGLTLRKQCICLRSGLDWLHFSAVTWKAQQQRNEQVTWIHQNHRGDRQHPNKHLWAHSAASAKGSPPIGGHVRVPCNRQETGVLQRRELSSCTWRRHTRETGLGPDGQLCPCGEAQPHGAARLSSTSPRQNRAGPRPMPWHSLRVRPGRGPAGLGEGAWSQSLLEVGPVPALTLRPPSPRTVQREIPFCRVCALDSFPRFTWKPLPRDGVLPAPRNTNQTN